MENYKHRPYVICHMLMSYDGKVTGNFLFKEEAEKGVEEYYRINRLFDADAFACGRVTMQESFTNNEIVNLTKCIELDDLDDFIAIQPYKKYAVSFDRFGKVAWKSSHIEDEDPGYDKRHIIEVLTENVDKRYLSYLRERNISYIFAGKDTLNIEKALKKLHKYFNINTLLLEGGAIINTAFEDEYLIDELSIVEVPLLGDESDKNFFLSTTYRQFTLIENKDCLFFNYKRYKAK